jgi:hypothetical protein
VVGRDGITAVREVTGDDHTPGTVLIQDEDERDVVEGHRLSR